MASIKHSIALLSALATIGATSPACEAKPCFTKPVDSLETLNKTLNGRVQDNRPFAHPCFSMYEGKPVTRDAAACAAIIENYHSVPYRAAIGSAYGSDSSDACIGDPDDRCILDTRHANDTAAWEGQNCRQGDVPPHIIDVRGVCDVQAALSFSRETGRRLVVKNSGHDFNAHSSGRGALALWTRHLQKKEYNPAFVAEGAPASEQHRAITIGAGVNCGEAYGFARDNDITILCGYSATVGMSGGWVLNAGHSVLSPAFGLGIDRVLEFKVVTADGKLRVANAHQNQDLFWALRGGGGQAFGIVIESTHKAEANFPVVSSSINFPSTDLQDIKDWVRLLASEAVGWSEKGWGGHIIGNTLVYITAKESLEDAKKTMQKATDFALARGGKSDLVAYDSWHPFYENVITKNPAMAGGNRLPYSRLIAKDVIGTKEGQDKIYNFYDENLTDKSQVYIDVTTPIVYKDYKVNSTSATEGWRNSVWHLVSGLEWSYNATTDTREDVIRDINRRTRQLHDISPNTGAYMNEASMYTSDWKQAFWGEEKYATLLAIKKRYDPEGILNCFRCVGWEDSDEACMSAFQNIGE
ncbi:hypothetical protein VHEMI00044 [[Torrubiella] hemipterigena]|uniref:FAD-binding PCMH-type domain-containing protein n=1 Tax=[Torrubiella] hemipterigena TaxID=1531966 RepID=A0A0A1T0Q0_9HYPO|nr:hypothetical protein VHEMI00044 [[Torrubiella] hemipterigena]